MPLRDGDLTPELRRRLRAAGLDVRSRAPSKVSRAEGSTRGSRVRCHACGEEGELPAIERHVADEHGGGRIDDVGAIPD